MTTSSLALLETLTDLRSLPKHIPGKAVTVTLAQLPDYLEVNQIKAVGMWGDTLIVKAQDAPKLREAFGAITE